MVAKVFTDILRDAELRGLKPGMTARARDWFREQAKNTKISGGKLIAESSDSHRANPHMGKMMFFRYDAKYKKTLPYWDMYPLVFPISRKKGQFWGFNMHYLQLPMRAALMDGLYRLATTTSTATKMTKVTKNTKLRTFPYESYGRVDQLKFFRPTVHSYLLDKRYMKSPLVIIDPRYWDIALFLPVQRFVGASQETVHRESRESLGIKRYHPPKK